jgi:hypothetical protein
MASLTKIIQKQTPRKLLRFQGVAWWPHKDSNHVAEIIEVRVGGVADAVDHLAIGCRENS